MKTMKFKKISDKGNYFGWKLIEVLQFNYDGEGGAITLCDGIHQTMTKKDILNILTMSNDEYIKIGKDKLIMCYKLIR